MMPFFSPLDLLRNRCAGRRNRRVVSAACIGLALWRLRYRPGCCSRWSDTTCGSLLLCPSLLCRDALSLFRRNAATLLLRPLRGRGWGRGGPSGISGSPVSGWLTRRSSGWIRRSPNAGRCRCLSTGRRSAIPGSSLLLSAAARCFSLLSRGSGGRGVHGRPDIIGGRLRIGRP